MTDNATVAEAKNRSYVVQPIPRIQTPEAAAFAVWEKGLIPDE